MRLRPAAIRVMGRSHRSLYRLSRGRLLGRVAGMPVLLLTTTGRRSGRPRTTPLTYFELGDDSWSSPRTAARTARPRWWLNLQAEPRGDDHARHALGGRHRPRGDRRGARAAVAADHRDPCRLRGLRAAHDPSDPGRRAVPDQRKCTESVAPSSSSPTNRRLRFNRSGGLQPPVPRARCTGEDRATGW